VETHPLTPRFHPAAREITTADSRTWIIRQSSGANRRLEQQLTRPPATNRFHVRQSGIGLISDVLWNIWSRQQLKRECSLESALKSRVISRTRAIHAEVKDLQSPRQRFKIKILPIATSATSIDMLKVSRDKFLQKTDIDVKSQYRVVWTNLDNRSRSDNDVYQDLPPPGSLARSFSYREVQLIPVWSHPPVDKRGWLFGSSDSIAVELPASNRPNPSPNLSVSLRPQIRAADEHPPSFFPASSAVTLRPVMNAVDLASRAIWVTALLDRPIADETNWLWERWSSDIADAYFWENHSDDAIVSIKAL